MWTPAGSPHREHLDEARTRPILRGKKIGAVIVPVLPRLARRIVPFAKRKPLVSLTSFGVFFGVFRRLPASSGVFRRLPTCWRAICREGIGCVSIRCRRPSSRCPRACSSSVLLSSFVFVRLRSSSFSFFLRPFVRRDEIALRRTRQSKALCKSMATNRRVSRAPGDRAHPPAGFEQRPRNRPRKLLPRPDKMA